MALTEAQPFLVIEADVDAPIEPGDIGAGVRRCMPITGGRVSGAIEGEILPGGADWQTVRTDGTVEIEARYPVRTSSGAVVEVISSGLRVAAPSVRARLAAGDPVDPSEYYFRTAMRFRTGDPALGSLNDRLGIARGARGPRGVRLEVFEVL